MAEFKKSDVLKKGTFFIKVLFTVLIGFGFIPVCQAQNGQNGEKLKTIIIDPGHGGSATGAKGHYQGGLESYEKNIVLGISLKLVKILKKEMPGVDILPTRTNDTTMTVREKAQFANDHNGDLFISIHADAVVLKTGVNRVKKGKRIVRTYYKIPTARRGTSTLILVPRQNDDKIKAMENSDMEFIMDEEDSSTNIDNQSPEWKAQAILYSQKYFRRSYQLANLVQEEVAKTGRPDLGVWQRKEGIWVLHATRMPAILIETGFVVNYDDERYLNSEKGQQELAESIAKAIIKYKEAIDGPIKTAAGKE